LFADFPRPVDLPHNEPAPLWQVALVITDKAAATQKDYPRHPDELGKKPLIR